MSKKNKKIEKRKISFKKIFVFLFVVMIVSLIIKVFNTNITNIYISGNNYFTDQEIIDISELNKYPKTLNNYSFKIEKRLKSNKYILDANVKKNLKLNKVYIDVKENYPLFYYKKEKKTILYDGAAINENVNSRELINEVPIKIYKKLIENIKKIDINILDRISEIKYEPKDKQKERFLLLMTDGNYISITLDRLQLLNKYVDAIKYFEPNEKGIIKWDSGNKFDKFDE